MQTYESVFGNEREPNLPSLSCRAALELDFLMDGTMQQGEKFEALKRLSQRISKSTKEPEDSSTNETPRVPFNSLDPIVPYVVHEAIMGCVNGFTVRPSTVSQLMAQAKKIVDKMKEVISDPQKARQEQRQDLEDLKSFCLRLCDRALALEESFCDNEPPHPFMS